MRLMIAAICFSLLASPAQAIVGGARAAREEIARHVVMIVGSRGTSCTGAVIARDLVLTAGHCVMPGAIYKIVEFDTARKPVLKDVASVTQHPQFDLKTMLAHRATADVALIKLAAPLPSSFVPAALGERSSIAVGESFILAGTGLAVPGDGRSGGTVRSANLVATGHPGSLQLRLVDPATKGERAGLSACTGDSGAPVFSQTSARLAVIGVVSWSTGPNASAGCGGLTGVTPLTRYRGWITETAERLGSHL